VEYIAVVGRDCETLTTEHLPDALRPVQSDLAVDVPVEGGIQNWIRVALTEGLEKCLGAFEKQILEHVVRSAPGIEEVARELRMSKPTLYRRLKQYGIDLDVHASVGTTHLPPQPLRH
jgi:DNA-binding NtrC family response regulator